MEPTWLFDLVAPDDSVRGRALARHRDLVAERARALHWMNGVWARGGSPAPREPHLAAELDQARAAFRWFEEQTVHGRLAEAPFQVLFLTWERRYPDEWGARESHLWSPWGSKEGVLHRLHRDGVPAEVRPRVEDLVVDALRGPYRCKDWMYARLIPRLPGVAERARVLVDEDDPLVRLRARFALHVAAHPELTVKRVSWRRWLESAAEGADDA